MHLYWRVREELRFLGEIVIFRDPALKREYSRWCRRHETTLGNQAVGMALRAGKKPLKRRGITLDPAQTPRGFLN